MNIDKIEAIKTIPITSYLERKGIQVPAKGNICAFWRGDKNPSVSIDRNKNRWYDFGTGKGGSIIDLVMTIEGCGISQALDMLDKGNFSFHSLPPISSQREPAIVIDEVRDLQHPALIEYLNTRGISSGLASIYCKEVHYHTTASPERHYFAIGFRNRKGCWELRNSFIKIASGQDITFIDNGGKHLAIFEGFFDFLSYLEMPRSILPRRPLENYAILNSVGNTDKFLKMFPKVIKTVSLYLDADNAGRQATNKIVGALKKEGVEILFDVGSVLKLCSESINDINDLLIYHQQQTA